MSWSKDSDGGKPKFLDPIIAVDVSLYSPNMVNRNIGIKSPGWVYYKEHEKQNGSIKRYVEPIVSFSGNSLGYDVTYNGYDPITKIHHNPPLATGLNGVTDWTPAQPFIDVFKTARNWVGNAEDEWARYQMSELVTMGHIDENGWVRSIPSDLVSITTAILTDLKEHGDVDYYSGKYTLTYDGEGTINIGGSAENIEYGNGIITFDYNDDVGRMIFLDITTTNTSNYIRNIKVVHERNLSALANGEIFEPLWLETIRNFRTVRFMDWMTTNNSPITSYESYPDENWFSWNTVPVSVMVKLANLIKADAWFNIPHLATDDFVEKMAIAIRDSLDPRLNAIYEYSNEFWNWQFGQTMWCRDRGNELWPVNETHPDNGDVFIQYGGKKSIDFFEIIDGVYGNATNYKKAVSTQTEWLGLEVPLLTVPRYKEDNPSKPATHEITDYYCVTGYFDGGFSMVENEQDILNLIQNSVDKATQDSLLLPEAQRAAYVEEHKFDQAYQYAEEQILGTANHFTETGRTISSLKTTWEYHKNVCDTYNMSLMMYEGGTHMIIPSTLVENDLVKEFYEKFNYTEQIANVYAALFNAWVEAGGNMFNIFVECAGPSIYGYWGAKRSIGDNGNPKWLEIEAFNIMNTAWWETRPRGTFG